MVRGLADAVHAALVATCNVPQNDRFQLVSRFAPDAMMIDPTYPHFERTSNACVVEITFLNGRSDDQKRMLYRHIVAQAVHSGFSADDIVVALTENVPIDWSLGRGEAFSAHQLADGSATEHSKFGPN